MAAHTERGEERASDAVAGVYGLDDPARVLALAAGLVLTGAYVGILYHVTAVVGGTRVLAGVVVLSLAVATVLARTLAPRAAAALGATLLVAGFGGYLQAVPFGWLLLSNLGQATADAVALLTGLSVLRMTEAGVWAIGFAPGPVFLSWYLLVRGRYAGGVAVGGAALGVFVLTGDAGTAVTLAGVGGGAAAVGFGEIERREGTIDQMETLVVLLATMVLVGGAITVVPTGESQPLLPDRENPTVEGGLTSETDRVAIVGSVRLSPEVRFVVESDAEAYWRAGAYDRYTGQGWVRSGQARPLEGRLRGPPGPSRRIEQRFTAHTAVGVMPAAWRPLAVGGEADDRARVTALGSLTPSRRLSPGDSYRVVSAAPVASPADLQAADTDYPDDVEARYTQLPESTPDRVARFTADIARGASSPYETAVRIERWLEGNKDYSLTVERPEGTVADSFLFEMEAGYCTYFATTMVTMLRTQGIPARFVTGYTPGQRIAEDRWVVRGLDSHAWVEVYFPDVGWVRFDPTPGGPRRAGELDRLEEARENDAENVDAAGSENGTWTPTPGPAANGSGGRNGSSFAGTPALDQEVPGFEGLRGQLTPYPAETGPDRGIPSRHALGFGVVLALGLAAAVRRTEAVGRAYRLARIRWQGTRRSPDADVERAFERLEFLLARRYRERRPGETRRTYLRALDSRGLDGRAHRVGALYERARYGGGVSRAEADEAVALVDELARERLPLLGRL